MSNRSCLCFMFLHAPIGYECPFCLLIRGIENDHVLSVASDIVFRNEHTIAFICSHQWPSNLGHVVVIPNQHFENIYELPISLATEVHKTILIIALALKAVYKCQGISTRQHNEPSGNQDVWHYHQHVFPRYLNDHLYTSQKELMPVEKRAIYALQLMDYLNFESSRAEGKTA